MPEKQELNVSQLTWVTLLLLLLHPPCSSPVSNYTISILVSSLSLSAALNIFSYVFHFGHDVLLWSSKSPYLFEYFIGIFPCTLFNLLMQVPSVTQYCQVNNFRGPKSQLWLEGSSAKQDWPQSRSWKNNQNECSG